MAGLLRGWVFSLPNPSATSPMRSRGDFDFQVLHVDAHLGERLASLRAPGDGLSDRTVHEAQGVGAGVEVQPRLFGHGAERV